MGKKFSNKVEDYASESIDPKFMPRIPASCAPKTEGSVLRRFALIQVEFSRPIVPVIVFQKAPALSLEASHLKVLQCGSTKTRDMYLPFEIDD